LAVRLSKWKLDCHKCNDQLKIERGCEKNSTIPGKWQLDDWVFERCPLKLVTRDTWEYIRAYNLFDKGYLPNAGSWLEQSAKFTEAMRVIEKEVGLMNKEDMDEIRKRTQK